MKRRSFLRATAWSAGLHRGFLAAADGPLTADVYAGEFPPHEYGRTLEEAEATIQQVVERVFCDGDGMLLSGVNGRTMKPLIVEEVKNRPNGIGGHAQYSAIPESLKPTFMNYENSGQCCGVYLDAMCWKAVLTGDKKPREAALRTVDAVAKLWNHASPPTDVGGGGRGWFPKPYGGIKKVAGIYECSVDQYADVTLGLYAYHTMLADPDEKKRVEEIIISFSDWWIDHDYSGVYFGKPIWWKRLDWHPMAASDGRLLFPPPPHLGRVVETHREVPPCVRQLAEPESGPATARGQPPHLDLYARHHGPHSGTLDRFASRLEQTRGNASGGVACPKPGRPRRLHGSHQETLRRKLPCSRTPPGAWHGLRSPRAAVPAGMHPPPGFTCIRRGISIGDVPAGVRGDDFLDVFLCENHVHWLNGYWGRRRLASSK